MDARPRDRGHHMRVNAWCDAFAHVAEHLRADDRFAFALACRAGRRAFPAGARFRTPARAYARTARGVRWLHAIGADGDAELVPFCRFLARHGTLETLRHYRKVLRPELRAWTDEASVAAARGHVAMLAYISADRPIEELSRSVLDQYCAAVRARQGDALAWLVEHKPLPEEFLSKALYECIRVDFMRGMDLLLEELEHEAFPICAEHWLEAVRANDEALLERVSEYVDLRDALKYGPVVEAVRTGADVSLRALRDYGFDVHGLTALAFEYGHQNVVHCLDSMDVLDITPALSERAFDAALRQGQDALLEVIIAHQPDVSVYVNSLAHAANAACLAIAVRHMRVEPTKVPAHVYVQAARHGRVDVLRAAWEMGVPPPDWANLALEAHAHGQADAYAFVERAGLF